MDINRIIFKLEKLYDREEIRNKNNFYVVYFNLILKKFCYFVEVIFGCKYFKMLVMS